MEPDGAKGLWFGVVMGSLALLAGFLQRTRFVSIGALLAATVAVFVGGWLGFEAFAGAKRDPRRYLMIVLSLGQLSAAVAYWLRSGKTRRT
jgi:hypothetical protein